MALPKPIEQLVQDIFTERGGDRKRLEAEKDPEACLTSLLLAIREELPDTWRTLSSTVEHAAFRENIEEARQHLQKVTPKSR